MHSLLELELRAALFSSSAKSNAPFFCSFVFFLSSESKTQPAKAESRAGAKATEPTDEPIAGGSAASSSSSGSLDDECAPVEKTSDEDEKEKAEEPTKAPSKPAAKPAAQPAANRSQAAKVSACRSSESSPAKTGSPTPTKASLARAAKTRSGQPVVSRAKTVDLGKANAPATTAARKASSVDQQPAKVVRQSSLGAVQSQPSPTRAAPGRLSLRSKGSESPAKRLSGSSLKTGTDESKKAAAPSGSPVVRFVVVSSERLSDASLDGEQSKRLLESNIDEQLNGVAEPSKAETLSKASQSQSFRPRVQVTTFIH